MSARRPWAWPLVPIYAGLSRMSQAVKLSQQRSLFWPVLSVGSLSAGGAGKTPVVIALARLLQQEGWEVDVLTRGYRRLGDGVEQVKLLTAERGGDIAVDAQWFGDEPVMMAQATGAAVWVNSDRFLAGLAAEDATELNETNARRIHLLDDGFQHVRLARSLDAVLLTREDLDDALLPAGNLRESLAALRRADVVVVREDEREFVEARVRRAMRTDAKLWSIRRNLHFDGPLRVLGAGLRPSASARSLARWTLQRAC
ncbi:tetraacyldisaccharide 4'-kinase [Granulicella cerasi]|uniref:Tetraacyldisaccharide 4'-kinase n=1 Tax=Granulicella cerasi TaxID=741063 RepID=A0ABW1ZEN9_9BACT